MTASHGKSTAEFVSVGEAARRFGVSVDTMRRWADSGRIASTRSPTGYRRFSTAEIDRMLEPTEAEAS